VIASHGVERYGHHVFGLVLLRIRINEQMILL
jgi:hypothetical protein